MSRTLHARPLFFDRWFDDLHAGDEFASAARHVSDADVDLFSALAERICTKGNADLRAAVAARAMRQRVVTGMLSLFAAIDLVMLNPERVLAIRRVRALRVLKAVEPDDELRLLARITRLRELDERRGLVTCRGEVVRQDERQVAVASLDLVWRRHIEALLPPTEDEEWQLTAQIPV